MKENEIFYKCVKAGMCDKGISLWDNKDRLINFAKQEIEFILENKPLTNEEIISFFGIEFLNKHSVFINQDLDISKKNDDIYTALIDCKGNIRLYSPNNIMHIAQESKIKLRVFSEGVLTIRLYQDSHLDLSVRRNCKVLIFNYGGTIDNIQGYTENVIIKDIR